MLPYILALVGGYLVVDALEDDSPKKFAFGGYTSGRYYKRNGEELRYIGIDEKTGKGIFKRGEDDFLYLDEDEFEDTPKEKKLFGFFKEGGEIKAIDNLDSFLAYSYPEASKLANFNGLYLKENFSISDGGTKYYTPEIMIGREDEKLKKVVLTYYKEGFEVLGEITLEPEDEGQVEIEMEFPEWEVNIEQKFEKGGITALEVLEAREYIGEADWKKMKPKERVMATKYLVRTGRIGFPEIKRREKGGDINQFYVVVFGFEGDDGYTQAKSKPILAKNEDEAAEKLQDQFHSYEGIEPDIISVKKMEKGGKISKRYTVNVYYGGEMEDEELHTDSLEEAKRLSQSGEHAVIFDNKDKKFVEIEYSKGGYMAEGGKLDYKKISNVQVEDIDRNDAPDYVDAYISYAEYDGEPMTDEQIEELNQDGHFVYEAVMRRLYAKGGKVKFKDKVQSIEKSLLKRKKVAPKVQKDYGKTYSKKEAHESASRIVGAMVKKEKKYK